jgi:hypothetical protein
LRCAADDLCCPCALHLLLFVLRRDQLAAALDSGLDILNCVARELATRDRPNLLNDGCDCDLRLFELGFEAGEFAPRRLDVQNKAGLVQDVDDSARARREVSLARVG